MTQRDLISLRRERRRWAACFAALAGLALLAASPGQSTNQPKDPVAGSTVAPAPAKTAPTPTAAAVLTADNRTLPVPSVGEPQRRLLMLLLVHSAGPLGPYGALGR